MGSTRFPGKVLAEIRGQSLVAWCVAAARAAKTVDDVILAIPAGDQALMQEAAKVRVNVICGSEDDVLSRVVKAAEAVGAKIVVRVLADNPLIKPELIDEVVEALDGGGDYAAHRIDGRHTMSFTTGFFSEAVTTEALRKTDRIGKDPADREHVTYGIYMRPGKFDCRYVPTTDPGLLLSIDTPEDLDRVRGYVLENDLFPAT